MNQEDHCDGLWRTNIEKEMSAFPREVLPAIQGNITGMTLCSIYPLIAVITDTGEVAVYNWIQNSILCRYLASAPATSTVWPEEKLDGVGASLLVGFHDGTLRWLTLTKSGSDKEEDENQTVEYSLTLQAVVKSHDDEINCLSYNNRISLLVSQGLDSKLFFYHLEKFTIRPLGFYINRHKVDFFYWSPYPTPDETNKDSEVLLIFCKQSYILEVAVPNIYKEDGKRRTSFYIEKQNCQVYKINGLLHFHELGDRISDRDILEKTGLSENERNILLKLKYKEKKEARENREKEMGLAGPLEPPKILCSLSSIHPDRIWLSLGKNDCGYLFEFILSKEFQIQPIDFTPVRAVEVITTEAISIVSMCYSKSGRYLFMGFQDGSLQMCKLETPFDISSYSGFKRLPSDNLSSTSVIDMKISKDGSIVRRLGEDGNTLVSNFNTFRYKEVTDKESIPSFKNEELNKVEDLDGKVVLSLENMHKQNLSEEHDQVKERMTSQLEELKDRYKSFKNEYGAYLEKCQEQLKGIEDIPDNLKLDFKIISCCPTVVEKFKEETKLLQREIDKKYKKDFVKISLLKQKYIKCFKSQIAAERFSIEEGSQKLQTFRECVLPDSALSYTPKFYPKVYDQKLEKESETNETVAKKKNDELLLLKQKLEATKNDIINDSGDSSASGIISKYNKRKQHCVKKLQQQIAEAEALENISVDESKYKQALEEINSSYFKFKDNVGYEHIFPDITCTFSEKRDNTLLYLKKINSFIHNFNSYAIDAYNMKVLLENRGQKDPIPQTMKCLVDSKNLLNEKDLHISNVRGKEELNFKRTNPAIEWKSYPEKLKLISKPDDISEYNDKNPELISNQWLQKKYKNLLSVLIAAKPKINCEKKFNDIRFILKCMELNAFKDTLSNEKLRLQILAELDTILETEKSELSTIMQEISSLRTLRQQEKSKWIDLYRDLILRIGQGHKYKGYFKNIFQKKIVEKGEIQTQRRHTSSESSESEQNIESDDDSQNVVLSEINPDLLEEVMRLRLKRQGVEDQMKVLKRKIRNATLKENTAKRRIQKVNDAKKEYLSELNSIVASRKEAWKKLEWPVVLYPKNIHSDYIYNKVVDIADQKQCMESEMIRIDDVINNKLIHTNNYVSTVLFTLLSRVISLEINDMIDVVSVLMPVVQNVATSSDKHFESLKKAHSLEYLEVDVKPQEPHNIIEEILEDAEVLDPESGHGSETSCPTITTTSPTITTISENESEHLNESESSLPIPEDVVEKFSLSDFISEDQEATVQTNLRSWRDVSVDTDSLALDDEPKPKSEDSSEIVSDAIPVIDFSKFIVNTPSSAEDYYMLPFTYDVSEADLKKLKKITFKFPKKKKMTETYSLDRDDAIDETSQENYPTYPGGGLKLTLPVLQEMENNDKDNFPYTAFYQTAEFREESKVLHVATHIQSKRTFKVEFIFNLTTRPYSEFILADSDDVIRIIKFYFEVKFSNKELEENLSYLQKEALHTKRAVNLKQHETLKGKQALNTAMKSRFGRVLDLDLLQDTIENPHYYIKKNEFETEIESLKKKLKKKKESQVVAQRSLDQLRFEDTKICYKLFELRKDFHLLNKNYSSKRKVLPKIGEITKYENDDD